MPIDETDLVASYRRVEQPLFNALYRMLWNVQDCQDTIHDAYLRMWNRRVGVDAGRIDALAWTTALNLARNALRWRRLREWGGPPAGIESVEGADDPQEIADRRRLHATLRRLPARMLEVILMAEFSGMGAREIAGVLGIAEGTVASRKHNALLRLRRIMGEG
jgi:RNA polymerase sigma-70 factor (ECF subfamily)